MSAHESPDASMRVPAQPEYVSMIRTFAAGLAARLDFTMDDIEDLRMAVSEGCATVLVEADPDSDLEASFAFDARPGRITVTLTVATSTVPEPAYDSFAWQVLTTLAQDVTPTTADGRFALSLSVASGLVEADA